MSSPKKVSVAVSDFALPSPRRGSIDAHSGFGRSQALGNEIHQRVQARRMKEHPTYRAEVRTQLLVERGGYAFEISGKIDGFFADEVPKIEEIKSSFNIWELLRRIKEYQDDHPYVLQAKTYAYFHWLKTGEIPRVALHLVSSRNGETFDYDLYLDVKAFESWFERRLAELVLEAKAAERRARRRKKAGERLAFPFMQPRPGQIELISAIEEGMQSRSRLLLQAPTGLGKTVGVLYPVLKEALGRGQRVVYVTPKNSQHGVAEDAVDRLHDTGANIKAMTLTAKSKMCLKSEPLCNPEYCEFARDYYQKVADGNLREELAKKRRLSARTFRRLAEEHEVCPFELQLEAVEEADTVICDYNYVFAPRSALGRFSTCGLDQQGKPNLVIDEVHNLPSRTMDYYSPSLSVVSLERMRPDISNLPKRFRSTALSLLDQCIDVVKNSGPADCQKPQVIDPPAARFHEQDQELRSFLSEYLKSDVVIEPRDVVLRLCFYWSEFTSALEVVGGGRREFFTTFHPEPATVKITCCDASELVKPAYDGFAQVVGFSATLKPFDFYARLSGLAGAQLVTKEFASPFPRSHRKLLIIPQVSSRFSARQRNYPRIAEVICKIASLKRGNYFVFFPSFDFLEQVFRLFRAPAGFAAIKQERSMRRGEIDAVLESLKERDVARIVFAVQGGVFSEGIDYPGEMIIGAFVVGPPLPTFDLERETMRDFYDQNYSAGFDYAYVFPAMAKAVQAAGRVIRSETDRGLIVLLDDRFIQTSFAKAMPRDWFESRPQELVSKEILADVARFWGSVDETRSQSSKKPMTLDVMTRREARPIESTVEFVEEFTPDSLE